MKVVLVDDHASLRGMLRLVLKLEGGYEVVGEAGAGLEALRVCRAVRPDIVILDLSLPELNGTHVIRLLRQEPWEVRVVVYTGCVDEALLPYLSPLGWEHINLTGDYSWRTKRATGKFQPLRPLFRP